MEINIPNALDVTFYVISSAAKAIPLERVIGTFQLTSVPAVGDSVRMTVDNELYGGQVLRVCWHLNTEHRDNALIEVYMNNDDVERARNRAALAQAEGGER